MPQPWEEKAAQAATLVAEVKSLNAEGLKDATAAQTCEDKLTEAKRLGDEAKAEHLAYRETKIKELQAELETKGGPDGKGLLSGLTMLEGNAGGGPDDELKAPDPAVAQRKSRIVAESKAARLLGMETKVMAEGTGSTGGYLVVPDYAQELFAYVRRQGSVLRRLGWLNVHPTNSNQIILPLGAAGTVTAAFVAENAGKPTGDPALSQLTINIFTLAGIAKASNQVLQDSEPTARDIVLKDLAAIIGNLEEQKVYSGTGTNEPKGILNAVGTNTVTVTSAAGTAQPIVDGILDAFTAIQTNFFGWPSGIIMHPRRLAYLRKGKDTNTNYLFNPGGTYRQPGGMDPGGTYNINGGGPSLPELWGVPIAISANIPTNLGAGTNEDRIIVGDWTEAHWFQRQDLNLATTDQSDTAFQNNQTWFRLEERYGFTAERYPAAFSIIGGTALLQT